MVKQFPPSQNIAIKRKTDCKCATKNLLRQDRFCRLSDTSINIWSKTEVKKTPQGGGEGRDFGVVLLDSFKTTF